jgi:hypothetical protein
MQIMIEIPDDLATALVAPGSDAARVALEALALEAYRERRLTGFQLRTLLGIPSRFELYDFLNEHKVERYTLEDFGHDLDTIQKLEEARKAKGLA